MTKLIEEKKILEAAGYTDVELIELTDGNVWGKEFSDGSEETYDVYPYVKENMYEIWIHGETPNGSTYTSWRTFTVK